VQSALVQPAAALDRLDYVLVIIDYQNEVGQPGATPAPTPTESAVPAP
jgi:hypothetical protein